MAPPAIARSRLLAELRALGLREGSAVLVHARMSALGWVVGGSGTVVSALLEALGPEGKLMAYASWHGYGPDSPLGRLVAAGGDVLMLGAPLETLTILHHAEAIAAAPGKRTITFEIPVATPLGVERRTFTDIDTKRGAYRYEDLDLPFEDEFTTIGTAALEAGIGTTGTVGAATCHRFPAADLVRFGAAWIDRHFT